jgi:alanine dehydrogenase
MEALKQDRALAKGVNTYDGHVTYEAVARDLGYTYQPLSDALGNGKKANGRADKGKKAAS